MVISTPVNNLYWIEKDKVLGTKNITPGITFYKEEVYKENEIEYRIWNPYKSKLAAAFLKGLELESFKDLYKILYLGTSTGTTISHISDIVEDKGVIYGVEVAPRVMLEFINRVAKYRKNIVPLFFDARNPLLYSDIVEAPVQAIYCDVAQPDQTKIAADNADAYLKKGGKLFLAIKSRSIDTTKKPQEIYRQEARYLTGRGFDVIKVIDLEPYEKDHAMIYAVLI
jgi:fibrillarin-like pre-rRNA processing protein